MDEKEYDLEDAVLAPECKAWRTAAKPRRAGLGTWFPQRLETRLSDAPAVVWSVMHCLLWLEFKAATKDEPLLLTNVLAARFGVSRRQKRRALDKLVGLGIVSYTQAGLESPKVTGVANWCR